MARRRIPGGRSHTGKRRSSAALRRSRPAPAYRFHSKGRPGQSSKTAKPSKARSGGSDASLRKHSGITARSRKSSAVVRRQNKKQRGGGPGRKRIPTALFGLSWLAIAFGIALLSLPSFLPDLPAAIYAEDPAPAITVLDVSGARIGTRGLNRGERVALDELPPYLPQAVMAVEDRRFHWHFGLDIVGLARALWVNVRAGEIVQGGSTITQQLAKNLFLSPDRTWRRKLEEAGYALWLEQKLTKNEILELYLNRVYLGAGTYGVEAASQRYFGKSAREVNLVEAALLAGLLKAPSRYAPTASYARASDRTRIVLEAMVDAGFLDTEERQAAYAMPARIRPAAATAGSEYILDWISSQIPDYVGPSAQDVIVKTTINLDLQRAAEIALTDTLNRDGAALGANEGAIVSIDTSGAVRALVGGRSYKESTFNRAVLARRQPGSAFKPFIYVAAIENGYLPWDVVVDEPVERAGWKPSNYSKTYRGAVTLETALAQSINTVAITLGDRIGRANVIDTARRFGILSPLEPHPSLALGTQEVSLYELTSAYASFANGGKKALPHVISEIRTTQGELIYERLAPPEHAIAKPFTIGALNLMLRTAIETGTGRSARLGGQVAAAKTGTSGDYRDAWFIGYTSHYITGVWIGNDDGASMKRVTGGSLPAQAWKEYMSVATANLPAEPLPFEHLAAHPRARHQGLTGAVSSNPLELPPPPERIEDSPGFFDLIAQALRRHSSMN